MATSFGQTTGRAGPNQRGGLPTKWSNDFVFNPDDPGTIYSVPIFPCPGYPNFLSSQQYRLPSELGKPVACATWIWDPKQGPPPWPGLPGTNPAAQPAPMASQLQLPGPNLVIASTGTGLPQTNLQVPASTAPTSDGSGMIVIIALVVVGIVVFVMLNKKKKAPMGYSEQYPPMPSQRNRKRK